MIFDLEYNRFALPRPDVTLLFDVSEASASENVDKKGFREYVGDKRTFMRHPSVYSSEHEECI